THITTALNRDVGDLRAVGLESPLYANTVRNLAHRESRVQTAVANTDNHALIGLQALALTFDHSNLYNNGITGRKLGDVLLELLVFQLLDDCVLRTHGMLPNNICSFSAITLISNGKSANSLFSFAFCPISL